MAYQISLTEYEANIIGISLKHVLIQLLAINDIKNYEAVSKVYAKVLELTVK